MTKTNTAKTKGRGWLRLGSMLTVFAIFLSLSLVVNNRLLGHSFAPAAEPDAEGVQTVTTDADGAAVINTTEIGKDVVGYAGATPMEITVKEGVITDIKPLPNSETPTFFDRAIAHLLPQWKGKSVEEAVAVKADACTGATYSSEAVIANVRMGLESYSRTSVEGGSADWASNSGWWCAIAVALCAAVLPFFIHNKTYRFIQLALNVGVLGFWTGTFLSYTVILSLTSNALRLQLLPVWILVAIAFLFPLFGKGNRYCTWTCPLGSLQQIAGMAVKHKPEIPHGVVVTLNWIRRLLWGVLMCLLWAGIGAEWIDFELFTGFMVSSAPTVVLWVASGFILLSIIVDRPFCRFVCPMGCAIDLAHNS